MSTFEYPEDRDFFAFLLTDGDIERLEAEYSELFDFTHPAIKREDFGKVSKKVLADLVVKFNGTCQLNIHEDCGKSGVLEPDHIIPLSSNLLNKQLRGMKGLPGLKTKRQSFGSNHPRNLTLACRRCNGYKKNRILDADIIRRLVSVE